MLRKVISSSKYLDICNRFSFSYAFNVFLLLNGTLKRPLELTKRGAYCMLTNHNTELINELYKDYKIEVVQVKRFINSNANNRVGEEVIITNY